MIKNHRRIGMVMCIIILALLGNVYAINKTSTDGGSNSDINITLDINYGQGVTQSSYVTLSLGLSGDNINYDDLRVQFSLDCNNWLGYNSNTSQWESTFSGRYQGFYADFYIGSTEGLKRVYVRVIDNSGRVWYESAEISLSSESQSPSIEGSKSAQLGSITGLTGQAGIKGGIGSIDDPYIISSNTTRLIFSAPNIVEASYYIGGNSWSEWYAVSDNRIDIPITLSKKEGVEEVRVKGRDKYGVEGEVEVVYYALDIYAPVINVYSSCHSFIALEGRLDLDLEIYDAISTLFDVVVKIKVDDVVVTREGKVRGCPGGKPTITSLTIEGLPEGVFEVIFEVTDKAGNTGTKQISVRSI